MAYASEFVGYARKFIRVPYIWGGNNPMQGFDCSGFVCEVLRAFGYIGSGDYSSEMLIDQKFYDPLYIGTHRIPHIIPRGAILFFGTEGISHVAICVSAGRRMIEAGGGDRRTKTIQDAAVRGAFVRERPISSRTDLIAVGILKGLRYEPNNPTPIDPT